MPTTSLPDDPDLDHLRRQAKDLRRAMLAGEPDARAAVHEHHPRGLEAGAAAGTFTLSAAQLVISRKYGFASWPKLKEHVELVNRLTRAPETEAPRPDPADEFLRLACLTYGGDSVERRERAAAMLAADPALGAASIHAAAATADVDAVRCFLESDATLAGSDGGPYDWVPLMYLAYARHDPAISEADVLATARVLLRAGADPNAGYLWHGMPSAFTLLTGAFGEGEQGPKDQPPHPHAQALARSLLMAGADPNDSQALYNRMFEPGIEHLELLFEFGLGTGDGGPWRRRLGNATLSPAEMLDDQLWWAVMHDMPDRVALLTGHGVDVRTPSRRDGRLLTEAAAVAGHAQIVRLLVAAGADPPALQPVQQLLGALAAGDRDAASTLMASDPSLVRAARRRRPSLLVDAVAVGRQDAVELLIELGFDVNHYGRADVPQNGRWETPLHVAADRGHLDIARYLLDHGADPTLHDRRFDATPLGWARHAGQTALIELLEPLTPDPPEA
ncbi:MAG: ankyrin [Ilumatobacteraceae bacterium]|nr:ankyrin [Ilumatobacteraceae bacterium]